MLDASSVPGWAFASAFSRLVETTAWLPKLSLCASLTRNSWTERHAEETLTSVAFPLQRGYTHPVVNSILGITSDLTKRLLSRCKDPSKCLLICTSPFWAQIAESWPGPVAYYSLDFTYAYEGFAPQQILELDTRLCRAATLVFAVSRLICNYLVERAACDLNKISLLPNATLSHNLQLEAEGDIGPTPSDIQDLPRPIVGVIGNMADNLDWILLQEVIRKTQDFSWLFVGPATSRISAVEQSKAREAVMKSGERVRFLGARPYQKLRSYARALDVAVLPYRRKEPTYSGSAMRYYEHLAAGRPMIATPNVAELQAKEPFLRLVDNADQCADELQRLRQIEFRDGLEKARIRASQYETWDARAQSMMNRFAECRILVPSLAATDSN